jgi:hypothetical protein
VRPALGGAVFARVPLPFALDLDAGAVDQQVLRPLRLAIGDVDLQGLLASAQGADVRHGPIEADQPQEALDEAGRLAQRHAEQHLHGQAGLDSSIAEDRLSALLPVGAACRLIFRPNQIVSEPRRLSPSL